MGSPIVNTSTATETIPATDNPSPIIGFIDLKPIPTLDEKAECVFTIRVKTIWEGQWQFQTADTLANAKAWFNISRAGISGSYSEARRFTEVPLEEVVMSGDTVWEGNALQNRTIELKSTIRFPKDGLWMIEGYFKGDNWKVPWLLYQRGFIVVDGTAADYYSYTWQSGPLAYLDYFDYGYSGILPVDEQNPISLELDMTHPPLAGEEVTITCKASSPFFDISNLIVRTDFVKRTESGGIIKFPAKEMVIKSETNFTPVILGTTIWDKWKSNLNKGETPKLSATIKFPEPGEWKIRVAGTGTLPNDKLTIAGDEITLTITENQAYYGWNERR